MDMLGVRKWEDMTKQKRKADLVTAVPDSGMPAAIGYAEESKIPFELGPFTASASHYKHGMVCGL